MDNFICVYNSIRSLTTNDRRIIAANGKESTIIAFDFGTSKEHRLSRQNLLITITCIPSTTTCVCSIIVIIRPLVKKGSHKLLSGEVTDIRSYGFPVGPMWENKSAVASFLGVGSSIASQRRTPYQGTHAYSKSSTVWAFKKSCGWSWAFRGTIKDSTRAIAKTKRLG